MNDPRDALTEVEALAMQQRNRDDRRTPLDQPIRDQRLAAGPYVQCAECHETFAVLAFGDGSRTGAESLHVHTVAVHGRPASPAERTPIVRSKSSAASEVAPRRGG